MVALMASARGEHGTSDGVSFGFRRVDDTEKPKLVRDLFDRVANRYDLMNDVMSGGVHRLWKREMIAWLDPQPGMTVLDVAGGTGDIARRIADRTERRSSVIVCDMSERMVDAGREKAWNSGVVDGIDWVVGDAEALPLKSRSVDAYTIAFGIRNVTHVERALTEAHRVLRPGGRFLCLEFSPTQPPGFDRLYAAYSFTVIPFLGGAIAGQRDAYAYLVESIRRFPPPERYAAMIGDAGFGGVRVRPLSAGIAALHSGWRV
jgi:demethylmenaquinone methyltransferase/2-methoxy-6-polyprenyl-1,4-benzoquinol methylase